MIPTFDTTVFQIILAILVTLVLFVALVLLVMAECERRSDK